MFFWFFICKLMFLTSMIRNVPKPAAAQCQ